MKQEAKQFSDIPGSKLYEEDGGIQLHTALASSRFWSIQDLTIPELICTDIFYFAWLLNQDNR